MTGMQMRDMKNVTAACAKGLGTMGQGSQPGVVQGLATVSEAATWGYIKRHCSIARSRLGHPPGTWAIHTEAS